MASTSLSIAALHTPLPLAGSSEAARHARDSFDVAASRTTPVLIVAEAGLRPRVVAQALHDRTRAGTPFIALDSSALHAGEMEQRLFGTPPRRSTSLDLETIGADAAILEAGRGTLFLENADELAASAQRRLARVLRDGEVRLAGKRARLPLRIVASATRDLDVEVRDGHFRQDLVRRLAACRIVIPPLRQRSPDVGHILEQLMKESAAGPRPFTHAAITVIAALPWAGNIDELAGLVGKVVTPARQSVTQEDVLAHLPMDGQLSRLDLTASLRDARRRFERDYISAVLEHHQWRMSEAARALGIERANLYRKTRQLGIVRIPRAEVS
jgi:two-component system, NtrC family, nitrogen regulation response regulator NtrX